MDLGRYLPKEKVASYRSMIDALSMVSPFRSVLEYRMRGDKLTHAYYCTVLHIPETIEISGMIGGGLYIPHMHCVISVYKAGKNLSVLPGAVIGKSSRGTRSETNATIGDDVLIGANATVFGPVHIGDHVMIGAGAVVFGDVPDYATAVGNPFRVLRKHA
ncbi:hypothetical protein EMB92_10830 [Bifidobacterium callitrichos]|uniref:Serine acetyltransferase n=2 Tax=Bifidobacterium callitrichos TaxID=762209 RepID=A0A5M9Z9V1_9BIFI|nr:hypothetical protein EMB92_10830 [Bifidobacterium callitrichos]